MPTDKLNNIYVLRHTPWTFSVVRGINLQARVLTFDKFKLGIPEQRLLSEQSFTRQGLHFALHQTYGKYGDLNSLHTCWLTLGLM